MGRKVKGNAAHRAKKRAKEAAREIAEEQANQVATGHIQKKPDDCPGQHAEHVPCFQLEQTNKRRRTSTSCPRPTRKSKGFVGQARSEDTA